MSFPHESRQAAAPARPPRNVRDVHHTNVDLADGLELAASLLRAGQPGAETIASTLLASLTSRSAVTGFVDARRVGELYDVSAEWVRDHAVELGGIRLGDGPRGPWRFDLERVAGAMSARTPSERSPVDEPPATKRKRPGRRTVAMGTSAPLVPIRGEKPCL